MLLHLHPQHSSNKGKTDKQQAHVLIRYTVPPSKQEAFKDAWNEAEKGTEGEKGGCISVCFGVVALRHVS